MLSKWFLVINKKYNIFCNSCSLCFTIEQYTGRGHWLMTCEWLIVVSQWLRPPPCHNTFSGNQCGDGKNAKPMASKQNVINLWMMSQYTHPSFFFFFCKFCSIFFFYFHCVQLICWFFLNLHLTSQGNHSYLQYGPFKHTGPTKKPHSPHHLIFLFSSQ